SRATSSAVESRIRIMDIRPGAVLRGRDSERAVLDRLLEDAGDGCSSVLVLRGEAGIGKTALLEYLLERAVGCRVARAVGVQPRLSSRSLDCSNCADPYLTG